MRDDTFLKQIADYKRNILYAMIEREIMRNPVIGPI
jgi:hypothetical protein